MNTKALVGIAALLALFAIGVFFISQPPATSLSKDDAVNVVIADFPAMNSYLTTSLPPSFIEGKQASDGWYLAFIQRGSGIPGILNAHCFYVNNDKKVTATGEYIRAGEAAVESIDFETCAPLGEQTPTTVLPYGNTILSMGEIATFKDISIRPVEIVEDSRCPTDVQCIQAGTVRVEIEVVSAMGTSTSIVKLGQAFTTEGESITLLAVTPDKRSQVQSTTGDYRLTFNVVPQTTPVVNDPSAKCFIGGCSAQLCTDQPDVVSTCEYTESYACYKTATCERQTNGQCGWTSTPKLLSCLSQ